MLPVIILEFTSCSCHVPSVCHLGDLFYKFTAGRRLIENPAPVPGRRRQLDVGGH